MSSRPVLRVRKSGAVLVAALIALVGTVPFAGSSWALSPLLLIPIAVLVWTWRAGTDVYPDELRVRALVGGTRVPWDRIAELAPDERGRVSALLDNGNMIRLTGVTRDNLPLLLRASGHPISSATADAPEGGSGADQPDSASTAGSADAASDESGTGSYTESDLRQSTGTASSTAEPGALPAADGPDTAAPAGEPDAASVTDRPDAAAPAGKTGAASATDRPDAASSAGPAGQ